MNYTLHTSKEIENIQPEAYEALTCQTWSELIENAKKKDVPYVMITLCRHNTFSLYDTIMFRRTQQKGTTVDPLTRLPIKEIVYLFGKTFDIETENGAFIKKYPEEIIFHRFSPQFLENLEKICLEANNPYAIDETKSKIIASYQYTIGANLLQYAEEHPDDTSPFLINDAMRWFYCSANRGYEASSEALYGYPWPVQL